MCRDAGHTRREHLDILILLAGVRGDMGDGKRIVLDCLAVLNTRPPHRIRQPRDLGCADLRTLHDPAQFADKGVERLHNAPDLVKSSGGELLGEIRLLARDLSE